MYFVNVNDEMVNNCVILLRTPAVLSVSLTHNLYANYHKLLCNHLHYDNQLSSYYYYSFLFLFRPVVCIMQTYLLLLLYYIFLYIRTFCKLLFAPSIDFEFRAPRAFYQPVREVM